MLETYVPAEITRQRLRSGLASTYVDDFADWLHSRKYKARTLVRMLQSFAAWTEWLSEKDRPGLDFVRGFDECRKYVESLPRVKYRFGPNRTSLAAAGLFLTFLRERGVLPKQSEESTADTFPILRDFQSWMLEHRGVTEMTLGAYRRALHDLVTTLGTHPRAYTPESLRDFVLTRGERHGISYARLGGTAVRSFVRYLAVIGLCRAGLEYALPPYAGWKLSSVPRYLPSDDVRRAIASCPRSRAGIRDKAVILLLARLGMRAGDVVRLRLTDINWANGQISVCGKGRREDLLPLSREVGTAVLRYLQKSRPSCRTAELFVTLPPPFRKLSCQAVAGIVRRALHRAQVNSPAYGAHVLRHSAATTMLEQGASLAGIGAVLRHRSPRTTAHYAKVDIQLLSSIAQPWPEVASC